MGRRRIDRPGPDFRRIWKQIFPEGLASCAPQWADLGVSDRSGNCNSDLQQETSRRFSSYAAFRSRIAERENQKGTSRSDRHPLGLQQFLLLMGSSGECWRLRFREEWLRLRFEEYGSWKSRSG